MTKRAYNAHEHKVMLDSYAKVLAQLRALSEVTRRNTKEYNTVLMRRTMALRRARTHGEQVQPNLDPEVMAARAKWEQRKDMIQSRMSPLVRRRRELKAKLLAYSHAALAQAARVR